MIILIFLCLLALALINAKPTKKNNKEKKYYRYIKKDSVMSKNEKDFYYILKEEVEKKEYRILCQVALYEIVKSIDYRSYQKIAKYTIDFVIIDKLGNTVKCIELNDKSHNMKKRKKRDEIVRKVLKVCNIELIEKKAKMNYNKDDIEEIIKDI